MFRSILLRIIKPTEFSADIQKLKFCTKPSTLNRNRREINNVEIVGTLISDSFTLKSGTKALTVRTNDTPTKHSNHNVHLKTDANFTTGQRVYVSGKLQSLPVRSNDGKLLTASTVKASQLYVLNNESASESRASGDRNFVEVLGNISSDITRKNDHCTFSLATHYNERNPEEGTSSDKTSFHRVFAYDSELCKYIENKLKKRDRILLMGKIGHMTNSGDDGKRVYSGFIIADCVYQIAQRSSSADVATNETAQLSSESR